MPQYCIHSDHKKKGEKKRRANYNIPGLPARYCVAHKNEEMKNVSCKMCVKCGNHQPYYNLAGGKAKYCVGCKPKGAIDVRTKRCEEKECSNFALYGVKDGFIKYCKVHASEGFNFLIGQAYCLECNERAYYNFWKEGVKKIKALYCFTHKKDGMSYIHSKRCCECDDKNKGPARFNYPDKDEGLVCANHKKPNMVRMVGIRCNHPSRCFRYPLFNFEDKKSGVRCSEHKEDGMVNIKSPKCIVCNKFIASFNFEGKKPEYCGTHKKEGMNNVYQKKCLDPDCGITPSFNFPGETVGIFCVTHAEPKMECVVKKFCEYNGCKYSSHFNFLGKPARYCSIHKDPKMINVSTHKYSCSICLDEGKTTTPHFNFPNKTKGLYCFRHKDKGMINIKSRRCMVCKKSHAVYNYEGFNYGTHCKKDKLDGMVNVTDKMCQECGVIRACYGEPSKHPLYCAKHKKTKMICCPRKRCLFDECSAFATHGFKSYIPDFCPQHAPNSYQDLVQKECKGCNFVDILNKEGYCITCDPKEWKSYKLSKQRRVLGWLQTSDEHCDYDLYDQIPDELRECGDRYRPDIFFDVGTHYVIIEIDEYQHNSSNYNCDMPRMINIQQAMGLPVIFIRFNPDSYKTDGVNHNPGQGTRKDELMAWLSDAKTKIPSSDEQLQTVHLFYDGYKKGFSNYQIIDVFEEAKKFN